MKKRVYKRLYAFNMIEVALAMAVITLGIVGVLALLPPSLQNSNDARNDALACEAAANIMEFVKILHKNGGIQNYIDKLDKLDDRFDFQKNEWKTAESDFQNSFPIYEISSSPAPWMEKDGKNIGPELYFPKDKKGNNKIDLPLLYCETVNGELNPRLHVRLFYVPLTIERSEREYKITRVYLEVSWPFTTVYKDRKKRMFTMDLPEE